MLKPQTTKLSQKKRGWPVNVACQQTSSAEAVLLFMKGHEGLTSGRQQHTPVPSTSLQLQLGSAERSNPGSLLHLQSISCLCEAKLKVGSSLSGSLTHEKSLNILGRDKFPLRPLHFPLVR